MAKEPFVGDIVSTIEDWITDLYMPRMGKEWLGREIRTAELALFFGNGLT